MPHIKRRPGTAARGDRAKALGSSKPLTSATVEAQAQAFDLDETVPAYRAFGRGCDGVDLGEQDMVDEIIVALCGTRDRWALVSPSTLTAIKIVEGWRR